MPHKQETQERKRAVLSGWFHFILYFYVIIAHKSYDMTIGSACILLSFEINLLTTACIKDAIFLLDFVFVRGVFLPKCQIFL